MPEIGQKRDAAEAGLSPLDSVEDACKFVTDVLGQEAASPVVKKIKEQEVDGSVRAPDLLLLQGSASEREGIVAEMRGFISLIQ